MTCGFKSCPRSWHPIKLTKQAKFRLPAQARRFIHCVIKSSLFLYFSCRPNDFQSPQQHLSVTAQLIMGTKPRYGAVPPAPLACPRPAAGVRRWGCRRGDARPSPRARGGRSCVFAARTSAAATAARGPQLSRAPK